MSRILLAFYNGIEDTENENAMPMFYETFIKGLNAYGNKVMVFTHRSFGHNFNAIDNKSKQTVLDFSPDICILFNNAFYDISSVVDCPIVIYEVDSPLFYSNKEAIRKNTDRFLYFIEQSSSREILIEQYGIKENKIFLVPLFTEIYPDNTIAQNINISFVGTKFTSSTYKHFMSAHPTEEKFEVYKKCLTLIKNKPNITLAELLASSKKELDQDVIKQLNIPDIVTLLSGEKRIKVLSLINDLGLELYGTINWKTDYYNDVNLNMSYKKDKIYTFEHILKLYNRSKIGINISHLQAVSGFPWRVMDIMASNACLVTDYHSDFEMYFPKISKIIPTYNNRYEAYECCKKLLENKNQRTEIAACCNEIIDEKFRFKNLASIMEDASGITIREKKELTRKEMINAMNSRYIDINYIEI